MVFLSVIGNVGTHEEILDEVILIESTEDSVFMRPSIMCDTKTKSEMS